MKKYIKQMQRALSEFLSPVPEVEKEYVEKVVHLLRRDFTDQEQNHILFSISARLCELRDQDLKQMEKEYAILLESTKTLKSNLKLI
jgi:hypothetical protein